MVHFHSGCLKSRVGLHCNRFFTFIDVCAGHLVTSSGCLQEIYTSYGTVLYFTSVKRWIPGYSYFLPMLCIPLYFSLFLCLRSGLFLRPPDGITIESQQGEAANLTMRMLYKQLCLLFIHFEWKFEWLHSRAESLDGYWAIFALFLPFASRTFNQIERTKLT